MKSGERCRDTLKFDLIQDPIPPSVCVKATGGHCITKTVVVVLGSIIQELRGESFARYMKENLLAPVGMENSAFVSAGIPTQKDVALGYEYYKGEYYPYEQGDIIPVFHRGTCTRPLRI